MEYTVHKTEYLDEQGLEELWEKIKTYVAEHGGSGSGSGNIDLSDYATKEYVIQAIENIPDIDLSGYVVAENLATTLLDYAKKNHTHSEYLTEHQDISGKADVGHKHVLADITDYTEPDLSNYATQTYVTEQIANAQLGGSGGSVDLSAYAKTEDVNTALATKSDTGHTHTLSEITDYSAPDLSNYYTKEETYSKTEIDSKISSSGGSSSGGSSSTEFYSTEETAIGTWIDGRTVYRKVFTIQNATASAYHTVTHGSENVSRYIRLTMMVEYDNPTDTSYTEHYLVDGAYISNFFNSTSSASTLTTNIKNALAFVTPCSATQIGYYFGSGIMGSSNTITIIMEYIKTD